MRYFLFLAVLLLSINTQAQVDQGKCLVERSYDNRVSGKVVYEEYPHPGRPEIIISGYKLILTKPSCYELISGETGQKKRGEIEEIAIEGWRDNREFWKAHLGRLVVIVGQIVSIPSPYYIAPT